MPVDEGGGSLPPLLTRYGHHQCLRHGGMIHQPLLYGFGLDILAPRDKQIVEPPLYHPLAVGGDMPLVAGVKPASLVERSLQYALLEITGKQGVTAYANFPLLNADFAPRQRFAN